jgi:uncharacterized membrane protein
MSVNVAQPRVIQSVTNSQNGESESLTRKLSRRIFDVENRMVQVKKVLVVALIIQLIVMFAWSTLLYNRFALTWDFSQYQQGIWEIHHGYLNPPDTSLRGGLWGNSGQIIFWIIALVTWFTPQGILLLFLQDLFVVLTEVVVLVWAYELITAKVEKSSMWRPVLLGLCGFILISNPWSYWTISWDIHSEPFCTIFCVLAARALYYRRPKSLAIWSVLTITGGMVECEYIVALGILALTLPKSSRKLGMYLIIGGLFWFGMLDYVLHAATSIPPPGQVYGYLTNAPLNGANLTLQQIVIKVLENPTTLIKQLWIEHPNVIAVLSAGGIIGIFNRWGLFIPIATILTNTLSRAFAITAFQNFPAFAFLTIGTIMVILSLLNKKKFTIRSISISKIIPALTAIIAFNCLMWSIIWIAPIKDQWLRTSNSAATILTQALHEIPSSDEVVSSQGVAGRFSKRVNVFIPLVGDWNVPLYGKTVWWILTSQQGIELASPALTYGVMGTLIYQMNAKLVMHGGDVWVFKLHRQPNQTLFTTGLTNETIPGWTVPGPAGKSVVSGPPSSWHTESNGKRGYTVAYAYWQENPGLYQITLKLKLNGKANIEVWNSTANNMIARRKIIGNGQVENLTYEFNISYEIPRAAYSGWGPFQILPNEPAQQNEFEIRLWTPGHVQLSVYQLSFKPAPA